MSVVIEKRCSSLSELDAIASELLEQCKDKRLFALFGPMGAGKTTFTQAICRQLGVIDQVSSPTFAIINEYRTAGGDAVYHFDFYRIKIIEEAMDIGYEQYFFSGSYCFIEWPEKIEELLPEGCVNVHIEETINENERIIRYSLNPE